MREDLEVRIAIPEVREAFDVLIENMARFPEFHADYNVAGSKKSVHFATGEGVSHYAFIANSKWLLWYFRRPGVISGAFTFEEVQTAFPQSKFSDRAELAKREVTLRISDMAEAFDLLSFVARHRLR